VTAVLAQATLSSTTITAWMAEIGAAMRAQRDRLTRLDAAIGDGDHGTNMVRGFDAVETALAGRGEDPPGRLLIACGKTLLATVGGASGPLWGSALRGAGRSLGDAAEIDGNQLAAAVDAALASIKDLGAAELGDKTIVDALEPAARALRTAVDHAQPLSHAVSAAAAAAEEGAEATVPLQARKGRASYLGERSIGHQDPGATSAALILRALERAVSGDDMSEQLLPGLAASPGVAAGRAVVLDAPTAAEEEVPRAQRPATALLATGALQAAAEELEALARTLAADGGSADAQIVETGALMARDPGLEAAVERAVIEDGRPAVTAILAATDAHAALLAALPDELLAARADDVRSVGRRAARLANGAGKSTSGAAGSIAVAEDLGPADVADAQGWAGGIALAAGGPTAHAAIVARSLGLPMVTGVGPDLLALAQGSALVIDGEAGTVLVDPPEERQAAARAATAARAAARQAAIEAGSLPAVTADGRELTVLANVASAAEVRAALDAGAEGVGLLRTELLCLDASGWPSEAEHRLALRPVLAPLAGRVATVRVLDFGGDKLPPFLAGDDDGSRGIALLLRHPAALEDQLAAILAEGAECRLRILLPMVDDVSQFTAVEELLARARARSRVGTGSLGAMIETPAGVADTAAIAARAAFLSIGTNDLTASTLGVDRFAAGTARADDPRVLAAIARTVEAGHEAGLSVEVCGEAAGDPTMVPLLIGLDVDELSTGAARVAELRAQIRSLSLDACRAVARAALDSAVTAPSRS
jgi:dihydroxyacetone kinase phosphoprotein-dependent L subunit